MGRSHECDWPPSVRKLPVISRPKIDVEASGPDLHKAVVELVEQGLSIYRVDAKKLKELEPDLIVTQSQCEVCAASPKDLDRALKTWLGKPPRVLDLSPSNLKDILKDFERIAEAAGVGPRGKDMAASLALMIDQIGREAARAAKRPTVACIEWIEPLMAAGNWMPELVELAGGKNLFGEAGTHSPWMAWEDLVQADPDVLFILPCGFNLDRTRREARVLKNRREWPRLKAVRENRVYVTDGHRFFNRPGPRIVDSLEILAEALHPKLFKFGRRGRDWQCWDTRL